MNRYIIIEDARTIDGELLVRHSSYETESEALEAAAGFFSATFELFEDQEEVETLISDEGVNFDGLKTWTSHIETCSEIVYTIIVTKLTDI